MLNATELEARAKEIRKLERERQRASARECEIIAQIGDVPGVQPFPRVSDGLAMSMRMWRDLNRLPGHAVLPKGSKTPRTLPRG